MLAEGKQSDTIAAVMLCFSKIKFNLLYAKMDYNNSRLDQVNGYQWDTKKLQNSK